MRTLKEIEKRLSEITLEVEKEGADLEALKKETDQLIAERTKLLAEEQARKALLEDIAKGGGIVTKTFDDGSKKTPSVEEQEAAYRSAFLKNLLGEKLNETEERAFLHTTENTGAVIPKELLNKIYTNMEEKHPILKDVNVLRSGAVISIVKHTAIAAGDAKAVAEGTAADDEQNTFVNVTLSGKEFKKKIKFSYRLGKMAIPAFEAYLIREISDRLGSVMAADVIAQIKADLTGANKFNAATQGKLEMKDILKALSLLKGTGAVKVYANNAGIYQNIAAIEGKEGQIAFVPNLQENIAGALLGKPIKQEDALADGEILFLDPSQFLYNIVEDVRVKRMEDEDFNIILTGIAIAGGTMTNDKAGSLITVGVGA